MGLSRSLTGVVAMAVSPLLQGCGATVLAFLLVLVTLDVPLIRVLAAVVGLLFT